MEKIINRLKKSRTMRHIRTQYKNKYAFVGIGNHSINNLYPILDYLRVDLKYIVTQSEQSAHAVNENYSNLLGTNDLDLVLNDEEISGVFICASPQSHFSLIKKVLNKNKNVFVEKPPCYTRNELEELINVEQTSKGFVLVGFQKRYTPLYSILKKNIKNPEYYTYKYRVGNYPEGDILRDLFIHPLDIMTYLFDNAEIISLQKIGKTKGDQTFLMHVKHENGVVGNIELSSNYWWSNAHEMIFVNTDKLYFESKNTERLISIPKPGRLLSVPLEKLGLEKLQKIILYEQNNFLPDREQNQLYVSGYFNEIKSFLDLCENKKRKNLSSLISVLNTYSLMDEIQNNLLV